MLYNRITSDYPDSIISKVVLSEKNIQNVNNLFKLHMKHKYNCNFEDQNPTTIKNALEDATHEVALHEKRIRQDQTPSMIRRAIAGPYIYHRMSNTNVTKENLSKNIDNTGNMLVKINNQALERMIDHGSSKYELRLREQKERNRPFEQTVYLARRRPTLVLHRRTPKKTYWARKYGLKKFDPMDDSIPIGFENENRSLSAITNTVPVGFTGQFRSLNLPMLSPSQSKFKGYERQLYNEKM